MTVKMTGALLVNADGSVNMLFRQLAGFEPLLAQLIRHELGFALSFEIDEHIRVPVSNDHVLWE